MPIHAVDDRRLYRQIADQLTALIASGEFSRGQRLPSERDLAAQMGVSCPSVREAPIALEVAGLVRVDYPAHWQVRLTEMSLNLSAPVIIEGDGTARNIVIQFPAPISGRYL